MYKHKAQKCKVQWLTTDDNLLPDLHHGSPVCPIQRWPYLPIGLFLTIQLVELVDNIDAHGNIDWCLIKIHPSVSLIFFVTTNST